MGFYQTYTRRMAKKNFRRISVHNQILFLLKKHAARLTRSRSASQYSPDDSQTISRKRIPEAFSGFRIDKGGKNKKKAKVKIEGGTEESSTGFCEICQDFIPTPLMFIMSECDHCYCRECISGHVGNMLRQNILKLSCPGMRCDVELKPSYFRHVLPQEVVRRWETGLRESIARF